jgi:hypothetical protein
VSGKARDKERYDSISRVGSPGFLLQNIIFKKQNSIRILNVLRFKLKKK